MDDKRDRFEAQVLPHLDAAYRFARWLGPAGADADDVVQEAFLRAFRAFDSLRGTDVKGWLLTIVRNCHATAARQQQRAPAPLPEEEGAPLATLMGAAPDPQSATLAHEAERTLAHLIAALPEQHREVLLLREMEELSYREIAQVTQLPIGTVMSRLARARSALKSQYLQQQPGAPHAMR
jgi:RNA polymerase sigma-70 factor (ECF subfamily)